jgi:hypothetical protein
MKKITSAFLVAVATQLIGCASVSNGTTGTIRIETVAKDGKAVEGAKCNLSNDSGTVSVVTPGSVMVHRSSSDLKIDCKNEGAEPSTATGTAVSRVTGSMFGNILLGGGIGAIVDHSNGSAYNYPEWMRLVMGEISFFDRKDSVSGVPSVSHPPKIDQAATSATPTGAPVQK